MNPEERNELNRLAATGLSAQSVLDIMVMRWNGRWIMSGEEVRCRQCNAPQWPSNAHDPMRHRLGCGRAADLYPWHDLAELLRALPPMPA